MFLDIFFFSVFEGKTRNSGCVCERVKDKEDTYYNQLNTHDCIVENISSKCLLGIVAILNLWPKSGLERSSPSQSDSKHTSLTIM